MKSVDSTAVIRFVAPGALLWLAACGGTALAPDGGVDAFVVPSDTGPVAPDAPPPVDAGHDAPGEALLTLSPTPFAFGAWAVGCESAAQSFTVSNTGSAGIGIVSTALTGLDATQFAIERDGCAGVTLAPARSCTVDVVYRPTSPGDHSASLELTAVGGSRLFAALTGRALVAVPLTIAPATRNFGSVLAGAMSTAVDFTVRNAGGCGALTLASSLVGANADQFHVTASTCDGAVLAGGEACVVSVVFAPTGSGAMSAVLEVSTGTLLASSTLTGTGQHFGLSFLPSSHDFGAVSLGCGGSAAQTFTLTNNGAAASDVTVTVAGANPADFVIVRDGCSATSLAAASSCTVDVVFRPGAAGLRDAILAGNGSGGVPPASAALAGVGLAAVPLTMTPAVHDFGTVALGGTASADFTVTNTCAATAPAVGAITSALTGVRSPEFHVTADTCAGTMLAGGDTCTIAVTFQPTATGTATATLSVSSPMGGMDVSDLSGSGR